MSKDCVDGEGTGKTSRGLTVQAVKWFSKGTEEILYVVVCVCCVAKKQGATEMTSILHATLARGCHTLQCRATCKLCVLGHRAMAGRGAGIRE